MTWLAFFYVADTDKGQQCEREANRVSHGCESDGGGDGPIPETWQQDRWMLTPTVSRVNVEGSEE